MIQNINFPEGTKVTYQRGSFFDQFSSDIDINTVALIRDNAMYLDSTLYSARDLTGLKLEYGFYDSNCIYKATKAGSYNNTFGSAKYLYDFVVDKTTISTFASTFSGAQTPYFMYFSASCSTFTSVFSSTPLKYLTLDVDTSNVTSLSGILPGSVKAVYGPLSIKKLGNIRYSDFTGYSRNTNLRVITLTDMGTNASQTTVDCSYWDVWGVNTSFLPDSRNSLIDSLITYSFDRAAAGYSACTIKLTNKTKGLLTEEEIAQITAKGFTIS